MSRLSKFASPLNANYALMILFYILLSELFLFPHSESFLISGIILMCGIVLYKARPLLATTARSPIAPLVMLGICVFSFHAYSYYGFTSELTTPNGYAPSERSLGSIARLTLIGVIILTSIGAGKIVALVIRRSQPAQKLGDIICLFFLGASSLSLLFSTIGLLESLGPVLSYLTIGLCCLIGVGPVSDLINQNLTRDDNQTLESSLFQASMAFILLYTVMSLLLMPSMLPGSSDHDTLEHYIAYYRNSITSGSTWSPEVPIHFFISKGAGLMFLFGMVTDYFVQMQVSAAYILMSLLVVYDLINKSSKWQWLALAALILSAAQSKHLDLFKHHGVFHSYFMFFIWAALNSSPKTFRDQKMLMAATLISAACISFYQPSLSVFIAGSMGLVFLFDKDFRAHRFFRALPFLFGLFIGLTLIGNYLMTGIVEVLGLRYHWPYANAERWKEVFGSFETIFFCLTAERDHHTLRWDRVFSMDSGYALELGKISSRYSAFWYASLALMLLPSRSGVSKLAVRLCLITGACFLFAFFVSRLSTAGSVARALSGVGVIYIVFMCASLQKITDIRLRDSLTRPATLLLTLLVFILVWGNGNPAGGVSYARQLMSGEISFSSTLMRLGTGSKRGSRTDYWTSLQQRFAHRTPAEIATLSSQPIAGYNIPNLKIFSQPSHTFGSGFELTHYTSIDQALKGLERFNYFHVNLPSLHIQGPASSLIYTKVFDYPICISRFKFIDQQGPEYLFKIGTGNPDNLQMQRICDELEWVKHPPTRDMIEVLAEMTPGVDAQDYLATSTWNRFQSPRTRRFLMSILENLDFEGPTDSKELRTELLDGFRSNLRSSDLANYLTTPPPGSKPEGIRILASMYRTVLSDVLDDGQPRMQISKQSALIQ